MPSNEDNKQTEFPVKENKKISKNAESKTKDAAVTMKKKPHSIGWFIGVIVLILISITFVLPVGVIGNVNSNSIVFGTYEGEKIAFTADPNNYFYNQYQTLIQNSSSDVNSIQGIYQVWNQAFSNTVFFTAINKLAKDAKIIASPEVVNRNIRKSFQTEDGAFDVDTYKALDNATKAAIKRNVEISLPAQIVLADMNSVISSNKEAEFVANMGSNGRSFSYIALNASLYPNEDTVKYLSNNLETFTSIEISMIMLQDENAMTELNSNIKNGSISFADAAKANSLDSSAENNGLIGKVYYFQLKDLFANETDLPSLFASKEGEIVGPYKTDSGYLLFQIEKGAKLPDATSEEDLLAVKSYLNTEQPDLIDAYLSTYVGEIESEISRTSFEEVAEKHALQIYEVSSTAQNIGASTLLPTLQYSDPAGLLYTASLENDYNASLYKNEVGTVLPSKKVNTSYIITKLGEDEEIISNTSFVKSYYPYIASNLVQSDLQNRIFGSDDFDNQFMTVFFDKIYNLSDN